MYLRGRETAKNRDIADLLGLSMARTREILSVMDDVEALWSVYELAVGGDLLGFDDGGYTVITVRPVEYSGSVIADGVISTELCFL